nr:unnamed protein product [Callosobruchus chinensis]
MERRQHKPSTKNKYIDDTVFEFNKKKYSSRLFSLKKDLKYGKVPRQSGKLQSSFGMWFHKTKCQFFHKFWALQVFDTPIGFINPARAALGAEKELRVCTLIETCAKPCDKEDLDHGVASSFVEGCLRSLTLTAPQSMVPRGRYWPVLCSGYRVTSYLAASQRTMWQVKTTLPIFAEE